MSRSEAPRLGRLGRRGSVAVEAAVSMLLIGALVGAAADLTRYARLAIRAERAAFALADLVARAESVRDRAVVDGQSQTNDIGVFLALAAELASPEDLTETGGVTIASVTPSATGRTVNWVRAAGPLGDVAPDRLKSGPPLPAGMPFVVVEIALPFDPVMLDRPDLLGAIGFDPVVRRLAVMRPRSAALTTLEAAP